MLLVGLTGSIGTGKSTTAAMFKEHGFGVYNADDAVHYIYENDLNVIDKIEELFPGTRENNKVNRKLLRNILNEQPEKFKELESVVHPVTRQYQITYIEKLIEEKKIGCILDIPLLLENRINRKKILNIYFFELITSGFTITNFLPASSHRSVPGYKNILVYPIFTNLSAAIFE